MKRSLINVGLLMIVCSIAVLAEPQGPGANPLVGTWKLNLAKSKYSPGPPPKSGTTKIEAVEGGIRLVNEGVNDQGQAVRSEYAVKFDGKDYPRKGTIAGKSNTIQDTAAIRKIDDHTYDLTYKLKGRILATARWDISRDGKTRTITFTGKDAQGRRVDNILVFEKQ